VPGFITETYRIQLVLFAMQIRTLCPHLAAIYRILIPVMVPLRARLQDSEIRSTSCSTSRRQPWRNMLWGCRIERYLVFDIITVHSYVYQHGICYASLHGEAVDAVPRLTAVH
jgi:hypothetical protein